MKRKFYLFAKTDELFLWRFLMKVGLMEITESEDINKKKNKKDLF